VQLFISSDRKLVSWPGFGTGSRVREVKRRTAAGGGGGAGALDELASSEMGVVLNSASRGSVGRSLEQTGSPSGVALH